MENSDEQATSSEQRPAYDHFANVHMSGPWNNHRCPGSPPIAIISERRLHPIALVYLQKDADFISAAPDLMMACKAAFELCTSERGPIHRANVCKLLDKAIAKAKGLVLETPLAVEK